MALQNDRIDLPHLLVVGKHWPEPESSAAGSRMLQLLQALKPVMNITFVSAATRGEFSTDLEKLEVSTEFIQLNDPAFDAFITELQPDFVMFDRFMTEEQFGWRVAKFCPDAIRILDTEDLHGLRKAREQALQQEREVDDVDLFNDVAKREIAAIYRCDLSLIISEAEMEVLQSVYRVPSELLFYLPFMAEVPSEEERENWPSFEERTGFVSIGNFLHPPNLDAVRYLKESIWPTIRKHMPNAEMNIYGAYCSDKVRQLQDSSNGFFIRGRAEDAATVMKDASICLSPLRYGAGLKGKMITAMQCGTPAVTTSIGAEGLPGKNPFGGAVAESPEALAEAAVSLYADKSLWKAAQQNGLEILRNRFQPVFWSAEFRKVLIRLADDIEPHRLRNFTGAMLHHHSMRSTEFMARWIEEKQANRPSG